MPAKDCLLRKLVGGSYAAVGITDGNGIVFGCDDCTGPSSPSSFVNSFQYVVIQRRRLQASEDNGISVTGGCPFIWFPTDDNIH